MQLISTIPRGIRAVLAISLLLTLAACQATATVNQTVAKTAPAFTTAKPVPVGCGEHETAFDCDRRAILAMAGEYAVDFRFEEIAALQPDYLLKAPQLSKAREFITVLEDSGKRIVLQHVLVAKDSHVTKHWRQDWVYEPNTLWRYRGVQSQQSWQRETLNPEQAKGRWAQLVWQVDDSPRYAGVGQWQHDGNSSIWTSDTSWRPLPRREHTSRSDYDVMVAINRHEITPTGWVHWQDNLKMNSTGEATQRYLAREFGANTYTRISGYDFQAGYDYWQKTQAFWQAVRAAWDKRFASHERITLQDKVDDKSLWLTMFERAAIETPDAARTLQQDVDAILDRYLLLSTAAPANSHAAAR